MVREASIPVRRDAKKKREKVVKGMELDLLAAGGERCWVEPEPEPEEKIISTKRSVAWLLCIKLLGDAEKQWLLEDEGSREEERGRRDLWRSITCQKRCSVF
jgi:hypothetical protein